MPVFESLYGNEEQLSAHKKAILQACRTGDLAQLQQLYQAHNIQPGSRIARTEDNDGSPLTLPLIHYLLDYGADPRKGSWRGCGAIHVVLEFSQPLEIIDKMVEKGGMVNLLILSEAIRKRRLEVL